MISRRLTALWLTAFTAFAAGSDAQELRPEVKTVWTEAEDGATLAPDGSRIAFIDWSSGDIAVRNVRTGAVGRLTDKWQRQLATVSIDSGELIPIPFSPQTGGRLHPALHPNGRDLVYVDGENRTELKLMAPASNR